jgi:glutamine synthetase
LPLNLLDALRAFEASTTLREAFGSEFVDSYIKLRLFQWNDYMRHLTDWEREHTLDV